MKTLFVIATFFSLTGQAFACSCLAPKVSDTLKWADVVFSGEVIKVQYVDAKTENIFNEPRIIVTFNVSDSWKGKVQKTMTLHTRYNMTSCSGLIVKEGDRFLIYAKRVKAGNWLGRGGALNGITLPKPEDDILQPGICNRSGLLADADEDLKALGRSKAPTDN